MPADALFSEHNIVVTQRSYVYTSKPQGRRANGFFFQGLDSL